MRVGCWWLLGQSIHHRSLQWNHQHDWGLIGGTALQSSGTLGVNPHACWLRVAFPQILCPESHGLGLLHHLNDYRPPKPCTPPFYPFRTAGGEILSIASPYRTQSTDSLFCRMEPFLDSIPDLFQPPGSGIRPPPPLWLARVTGFRIHHHRRTA
jgi:hypothetical protein